MNDFVASQSGGLAEPHGITFGPDGDLFVALSQPAQVLRYDGSTGAFRGSFADASGAGEDSRTGDVVFHNGYLFVTTAQNDSVLRGSVTITDDDSIELFSDSFEVGSNSNDWNGLWFEDGQDDWFRHTQRATDGTYSAEVDGKASDATLTIANLVDLTPYASATVSFSWYIEGSVDGGEYLKMDVWNGTSWTEKASLLGNVDQENVWHHESIEHRGSSLFSLDAGCQVSETS